MDFEIKKQNHKFTTINASGLSIFQQLGLVQMTMPAYQDRNFQFGNNLIVLISGMWFSRVSLTMLFKVSVKTIQYSDVTLAPWRFKWPENWRLVQDHV